jgi:hypothetical protein
MMRPSDLIDRLACTALALASLVAWMWVYGEVIVH